MATQIGERTTVLGAHQTMFRLSAPLKDCYPDWSNVYVDVREGRERTIHRGWGYQKADGTWAAAPAPHEWMACYQPLTPRDLAFAEAEIAACLAAQG